MTFYNEYYNIVWYLSISIFLAIIIVLLSYATSAYNPDIEKSSAYECGFDPYDDARNMFDIQFYLVAIMFLIFDIETIFLFPWSVGFSFLGTSGIFSMIDFLLELLIGYMYIYLIGVLNWNK
jgi:NADH:ubiquinone oxidoreductase subunit 3 (subunit A)